MVNLSERTNLNCSNTIQEKTKARKAPIDEG